MKGFHDRNGTFYVDDVSIRDIAQHVDTPVYVYSASVIRSQFFALKNALNKALPNHSRVKLCYACKANSNLAILSLLRGLGSDLEIVSEGELYRGIKAGFLGSSIISTSFGKNKEEILACLNADIHQFNIESPVELDQVNYYAGLLGKTASVAFRLNPNVSGGGHHKISTGRKRDKFGNSEEKIFELYKIAHEMDHVVPVGLSVHIGSQVSNVEAFKPAFEKLAQLVKELRNLGYSVDRLDIGGGFPIIYRDEKLLDLDAYAAWVRDIISPLDTDIQMEPGRYLVGNAGVLLTKALYVKDTGSKKFLVVDAAMNDLIRPTLYEAYHGIRPVNVDERPMALYDVVGPICESGDSFAEGRNILHTEKDDLMIIQSAGAYGFSMASNYNSRPLPCEVLVDGGSFHIIRKRQTLEDLIRGETIPV